MAAQENEEGIIVLGTETVREENKDEESSEDLEEDTEEEDGAVEQRGEVFVQRSPFECRVVGGETPRKAQDGGDDGQRLVGLDLKQ